jgi:hypothetical protein
LEEKLCILKANWKGTIHWTRDQNFMRSAVTRKNLARANSNRWR